MSVKTHSNMTWMITRNKSYFLGADSHIQALSDFAITSNLPCAVFTKIKPSALI